MSEFDGLTTEKNKCLFIVEGDHEKDQLFNLIFRCFPETNMSVDDIVIYGTTIYTLYNEIVKVYGPTLAEWERKEVNLPKLVLGNPDTSSNQPRMKFSKIFLIFDYERQHPFFSESKILDMQSYFSNVLDRGQLFINYPMVEAYQHLCSFPDQGYEERRVAASIRKGREYKTRVKNERNSSISQIIKFPSFLEGKLSEIEISDSVTRNRCINEIMKLVIDDLELPQKIEGCLLGIVKDEYLTNAKNHIASQMRRIDGRETGQSFFSYARDVLCKIILHNIRKANKVQNNSYNIPNEKLKAIFQGLDLTKILEIQNHCSQNGDDGFIWVLCTCVLFIPQYNFDLLTISE